MGLGELVQMTPRRMRAASLLALQSAFGAALAWWLAHDVLGHQQPFFAPIAAVVALSNNPFQRARRTAQMVGGVLLGIAIAELAHPLIGSGAFSLGVVVLVMSLLVGAVGVGFVGEGMMFYNQAAAAAILVIALHRAGTGGERVTDALVGGAVALAIGVLALPSDPVRVLSGAERGVFSSLTAILDRCLTVVSPATGSPPAADSDFEWALSASHEVHERLTRLTVARRSARATVRIAPRRFRLRAYVAREELRLSHMYLLAVGVLGLMRIVLDAEEAGEVPDAAMAAEIDRLASAMRLLAAAPRPLAGAHLSDVDARLTLIARDQRRLALSASDRVGASARRVSGDLERLLPGYGA
jgi:uncharacterized membrane protein YgaE (UPF0421/DUF939 family)